MKLVRVAAAALNQTPLDWSGNRQNILGAIGVAREQEASILCLPELCVSGYGCEDAFLSPAVRETALRVLGEILPATRGMIVTLGVPLFVGGAVYDTCALVDDGEILGFVPKQALAGHGIHYEPRWFKPWPKGVRSTIRLDGRDFAVGDLYFDCGGIRIGFEICEDAWMASRPGASLALDAVDLILNPSASHFAFGKHEVRRRLVLEGSRAFGTGYVYANLLGNEAGRAIYDGDTLIAAGGELLAQGGRFSYQDFQVISATVDIELSRTSRAWQSSFQPQVTPAPGSVISGHAPPAARPAAERPQRAAWERSEHIKAEELARAVALGLFDYLRKTRAGGFVVSMSGGADSSAVACLVALMVQFAIVELGQAEFGRRLSHVSTLGTARDPRDAVGALLTGVYQATRNSSAETRAAARGLCDALGGQFYELDVDDIVEKYVDLVATAIGRPLSWERDDVALQNIQARVRSPGAWMLANVQSALLLATSNRSEAAVGYATMDGDTSGGISPIAGIDKAYLRRWLVWLEQIGPTDHAPIAALAAVNAQQPTAELRPQSAAQTDEADLMPYTLLDAIERAAIRDKRSPLETYLLMRVEFPDHDSDQLLVWVERFFVLWSRNQWKRERYAPSFHLDDANLDPKTWCRWPILSGGFQRELEQLRAEAAREKKS
jgi:NAD+ synthase (glutamine-hydrolysing)